MDKVVDFRTRQPVAADPVAGVQVLVPPATQVVSEYADAVVKVLEHLLEQARAGEIDAFAGGFSRTDGATAHVLAGGYVTSGMIGALTIVQHRIIDSMSYGTLMEVDNPFDEEDGCED